MPNAPVAFYMHELVAQVLRLYDGLVDEHSWTRLPRAQIDLLAHRLLEGHLEKHPGAEVDLRNWLPGAARRSLEDIFNSPLSLDDARTTIARSHGFPTWLAASSVTEPGNPDFERAIELLLAGNIATLESALNSMPDLVHRRSHYGHKATLFHYLAANGVETYRQRVPLNAASLATLLLNRGADPLAKAEMYGGQQTMRGLLVTSSHPHDAGVTGDVLSVLDTASKIP